MTNLRQSPMNYKNILVAIDLSEQSREILDSAHAVAQKSGARLHLTTVIKPMTQVYGGLDMAPISSGSISFEEEAINFGSKREFANRWIFGDQDDGFKKGYLDEENIDILRSQLYEASRRLAINASQALRAEGV